MFARAVPADNGGVNLDRIENELRSAASSLADGDPAAMRKLVAVVWPGIVRYCRARIGADARGWRYADAVAVKSCEAVAQQLIHRHHSRKPLTQFVYRTTARIVDAENPLPPNDFAALEPRTRDVMILRVVEGMATDDVATVLGIPRARVQLLQHQALVQLSPQAAAG